MFNTLHGRMREESGVAMVVSLMVAFVVLMLSTIVVAQSIHSLDSSGYDRQRLLSVNAAEAGINHWYQYLQTTALDDLDCSARSEDVASGPTVATFDAAAVFYAADGTTVMSCSGFSDTNYPAYAAIRSTGTVQDQTPRTIETLARLSPNYGGFGAAILAVNSTTFGNQFDIYGENGNDGDVYVLNGDLVIAQAINIRGNVYVPNGGATLSNNATVWGNLWTRDEVDLENPATIKGAVLSENGDIFGSPGGLIEGAAVTAGDVDTSGGLAVLGTISPATEVETTPTQTFPVIGYTAANWTGEGYTICDATCYAAATGTNNCQKAYNWLRTTWPSSGTGSVVLRITGSTACTFTPTGNNHTNSIKADVAVISDWGFELNQRSNWNGTVGDVKHMHFISVAPAASCPASGTSSKNISVANNTNFNAYVDVFFYTPCSASLANQNAFAGQVMATNVTLANNFEMNYRPVLVPGAGEITGFKQDIAYVREDS
jgi:hypothetical protein